MTAAESAPGGFTVRRYREGDLADLYRVCLLTGDAGGDASALYRDPDLLGHVYVGPYAALEPEHAWVLEDRRQQVCGYAVAALDSASFHRRVRASWWPRLRGQVPEAAGAPSSWSAEERLANLLRHPEDAIPAAFRAALRDYPSHLHIDLLPYAQGRGQGSALMRTLLQGLRDDGSPGVHLGVDARNDRALGFYLHLGFRRFELGPGPELAGTVWLVVRLGREPDTVRTR